MSSTKAAKKGIKANPIFKIAVLIICAAILIAFMNSTPPEGLEQKGWNMLGIMIVTLILFITEVLPTVCTCFLLIVMMYLGKIDSLNNLMKNACTSTLFFCMAGFGIGGALKNTNISAIIFRALWRLTKGSSKKLISAVIWLAAIVSVFIADSAAQVVTIAIVTAVIAALGDPEPGTSRLAGGIMLGVYVGAMTGGLALPCSNPVNVAVMELANDIAGKEMTFFQWGIFGVPIAILFTVFAAYVIPKWFNPEQMSDIQIAQIEKQFSNIPHKLQFKDIYFLIILIGMLVLWIASNWVKGINVTIVAIVGMILMMLPFPKVQLLTAKGYKENFTVMVPVVMLSLFPLAKAMQSCGLGEWLVGRVFSDSAAWPVLVVYIIAGLSAWIIHYLIPSGTASGALAASILGPIMVAAGIPVSAALICIGIQTSIMFILPIEGSCQHTFSRGYFTFDEFMKSTWPLAAFGLVMSCLFTPLIALIFGGML